MFDFEPGKLMVIGAVALVVIGPKELPRVLRQVGQAVSKVRRMAADFQSQFMDAMREAELSDVKEEMSKIADSAKIDVAFDPIRDIRNQIGGALSDGTASLKDVAALPAIADLPAPHDTPAIAQFEAPAIEEGPHVDGSASSSTTASPDVIVASGVAPVAVVDPHDTSAVGSEATMEDVRRALGQEVTHEAGHERAEAKPVKESAA